MEWFLRIRSPCGNAFPQDERGLLRTLAPSPLLEKDKQLRSVSPESRSTPALRLALPLFSLLLFGIGLFFALFGFVFLARHFGEHGNEIVNVIL